MFVFNLYGANVLLNRYGDRYAPGWWDVAIFQSYLHGPSFMGLFAESRQADDHFIGQRFFGRRDWW